MDIFYSAQHNLIPNFFVLYMPKNSFCSLSLSVCLSVTLSLSLSLTLSLSLKKYYTCFYIGVFHRRYRQAGDYVLKDEEDLDHAPVSKVTSQEVKAHYGLQPLHASPLDGHSSGIVKLYRF